MSENNLTARVTEKRAVFGDLTNRVEKRGFSQVFGNLGIKPGEKAEDVDMILRKQICLGLDNLVKEKCKKVSLVDDKEVEKGFSVMEDSLTDSTLFKFSQESISSDPADNPNEVKEDNNLLIGDSVTKHVSGLDACVAGAIVSVSAGENSKQDDEPRGIVEVTLEVEGLGSQASNNNIKDVGLGNLGSNKHGFVELSRLPDSQDSNKPFALKQCSSSKANACANMDTEADLIKSCSCPFCLKAAFLWTDAHYQDIKGRISALKKSQKEASILVTKMGRAKQTEVYHSQHGTCKKSASLESDLNSQWRSLFLRMEDIYARESDELHANFAMFRDLRENCRIDAERIKKFAERH